VTEVREREQKIKNICRHHSALYLPVGQGKLFALVEQDFLERRLEKWTNVPTGHKALPWSAVYISIVLSITFATKFDPCTDFLCMFIVEAAYKSSDDIETRRGMAGDKV
jgi:hypothetical protein